MLRLVCPRLAVDSLDAINTSILKRNGIRGFIFDLDNTIIPWGSPSIQQEVVDWLHSLISEEFKLCLLSNNTGNRVRDIAALIDIPFVSNACKPAKTGFRRALTVLNLSPEEVAVVGDQLFTDVLGGNRLNLFTIWVTPLSTQEFIGTKITRKLERVTVRVLKAKGLIKNG